ncbi:hypothetical protein B0H15DRAFT_994174, partial [Mycena belliarum]
GEAFRAPQKAFFHGETDSVPPPSILSAPAPSSTPTRARVKKIDAVMPAAQKPVARRPTPSGVVSFRMRSDNPFRSKSNRSSLKQRKEVITVPNTHESAAPTADAAGTSMAVDDLSDANPPPERTTPLPNMPPTTMGSLAPGRAVFRAPSTEDGAARNGGDETQSQESMDVDGDEVQTKQELVDTVIPPASTDADDFDWDDDDLQLLYPEPEAEPQKTSPACSVESSASRTGRQQSSATHSDSECDSQSRTDRRWQYKFIWSLFLKLVWHRR